MMKEKINAAIAAKFAEMEPGDERLGVGGAFATWVNDDLSTLEITPNLVVDEGLDYILDTALSGGAAVATWYVSLFKNNRSPVAGDTAATFSGVGVANEITGSDVTEGARPTWVEAGVSSGSITNSASPAVFTSAGALTAYGAFMQSTSVFGDTSGKLLAATRFTTARVLAATDILNITYTISIDDPAG